MSELKCNKYIVRKRIKAIQALIEQHGRIRVTFQEFWYDHNQDKHVPSDSLRRRILDKKGNSKVSYKGATFNKWSGYSTSCFVSGENVKDFKEMLKLMYKHDQPKILPIEVHYGWFFRKSIIL